MDISVRLDEQGRLIVPANVRGALGWNSGDIITVSLKENRLVFHPRKCFLCGSEDNLTPITADAICKTCLDGLGGAAHEERSAG